MQAKEETTEQEGADPVVAALDVVTAAAEQAARDGGELAQEARRARADRVAGMSVRGAMATGRPQRILSLAESTVARLAGASAGLRRAVVRSLAGEGTGVGAIARIFSVSHQRISALLRGGR